MRVLGIDPGLNHLGWGIVSFESGRLAHVANGTIHAAGQDVAARLVQIHRALTAIVAAYRPDAAAVEQTFVNRDAGASLKLGQARGIALLVPAEAGLEVGEYAPNAVKKAVVGAGHAEKAQVAYMVRLQLPGVVLDGPDAADALAVAICHAHHLGTSARMTLKGVA